MVLLQSHEISRFWLYPRMQMEKSERSKRDIVALRENVKQTKQIAGETSQLGGFTSDLFCFYVVFICTKQITGETSH